MFSHRKDNSCFHVTSMGTVFFLIVISFCSGCGSNRGVLFPELEKPIFWPEAPEKSRIKYVGQLSAESDLKREVSSMKALGRLIFGRENIGVFSRPHGLMLDEQDRLYIADSTGGVVHMMDMANRKYLQFFELEEDKRLMSPIGIVEANDNLYTADSILSEICVFDRNGIYKFSFGSDVLQRPSGIAYSPRQKKLYVADAKQHAVNMFDTEGKYLGKFGGQENVPEKFHFPTQLWVDGEDKLYVCDTLNYQVRVFGSEGQYLFSIGQHGNRPGYFAHPSGVATDSFGNIYVSDKQFENIQIFNSQGQTLISFGAEGNSEGEFWLPSAIFIDKNNRIYVADSFNRRIQVFQLLEGETP